jgi:hypothetical protein
LGIAALLFTVPALALGGREASANIVYNLSGATFGSPGGTATGTFTTNDARTVLVTYDITTSTVSGFPGFEYTPATAPSVTDFLPSGFTVNDFPGPHVLFLQFATGGLTPTGATISTSTSFELNNNAPAGNRFFASGSAVAVPEPSMLVSAVSGVLLSLGYAWRRRRKARAAA